jgi:serine/threonine protein phosphatase PrpC
VVRHRVKPRQDRFSVRYDEQSATLIISVCDGLGSLDRSHEAAALVTRQIPDAYLRSGNWQEAVNDVNAVLLCEAWPAVDRDESPGLVMATTFVGAALCLETESVDIPWIGDSSTRLLTAGRFEHLTSDDRDARTRRSPGWMRERSAQSWRAPVTPTRARPGW